MASSFIGTTLDGLVPGVITRTPRATVIESFKIKDAEEIFYGQAVTFDDNGEIVAFSGATVVSDDCYGFVVKPTPTMSAENGLAPVLEQPAAILRQGYIAVKISEGDDTTEFIGKPVYAVVTESTDGMYVVGTVTAKSTTTTGGKAVKINASFMSNPDNNKYGEISFRI